jgi:hypothetical protein
MTKSQFVKERKKKFNSCASCFKRFDDLIMRPWLIYNYERELLAKKEDFMEMFMKEGELWEKLYLKEQYDPEEVEETRTQRGHSVFRHIEGMSRRNSQFKNPLLRNSGLSIRSGAGERLLPTGGPMQNSLRSP